MELNIITDAEDYILEKSPQIVLPGHPTAEAELSYQQAVSLAYSCFYWLRTCHIDEVQIGLWHDDHYKQAIASGIDMIPHIILTIPTTAESDLRILSM
jgi:hypothetical protein